MTANISWLPSELDTVALRLGRVDEAVFKVAQLSMRWSYSEGQGPLDLYQVENPPGQVSLVVENVRPIPPAIATLFSEAINHLRATIDNTIFYLVEKEHGLLDENKARQVAMPIYDEPHKLRKWFKEKRRKGLSVLDEGSTLGRRIKALQPFESRDTVPSMSGSLAALMGTEVASEHPLLLLQGYSNDDKHRAIRMAAARALIQRHDEPFFDSDRTMRPVQPDDILSTVPKGQAVIVESDAAVHVERPNQTTWVSPARELDRLRVYVADVAIPMLVTGLEIPQAIPPGIDIGDTGQTDRQRIEAGSWQSGLDRIKNTSDKVLSQALNAESAIPPFMETNSDGHKGH